MKSHRECAIICGGGMDPPLLQAGIKKKKRKLAVQSIPIAQSHAEQTAFLPPHARWCTGLDE